MARKILNNKLKQSLAELVSTGLDVVQACRKLGSVVTPQTVYKEQAKDIDFAHLMDTAYQSFVMAKFAELNALVDKSPTELYPTLGFRDAAEKRRGQIDVIKFILAKVAPRLTKTWEATTKVEHSGTVTGITIVMDNYYQSTELPPIDITPKLN